MRAVIEYQLHTRRCRCCDHLTEAGWPEGVSRHTFGLEVSLGTVSRLEQEVAAALTSPEEEARAFVRHQGIVNVDETGWRQHRSKAWLWTAVTEGVTVFAIRKSRGRGR